MVSAQFCFSLCYLGLVGKAGALGGIQQLSIASRDNVQSGRRLKSQMQRGKKGQSLRALRKENDGVDDRYNLLVIGMLCAAVK